MRWTVRPEARTDQGEVGTAELVTFVRPAVDGTLADLGLAPPEAKVVLAKLRVIMVRSQAMDHAACHRIRPRRRMPQPFKGPRRCSGSFGSPRRGRRRTATFAPSATPRPSSGGPGIC
jgi:hypothetical protein